MTDRGSPVRDAAIEEFERAYGRPATGIVWAPGRINLIGEHIDYCGLRVLPMALRRGVWLAFRPADDNRVRVRAVDDDFEPREFIAAPPIPAAPTGDWSNYVRAAVQGVVDPARSGGVRGFDACIAADLPVAAGLSSSSALVVATALASLATNDLPEPDRLDLAVRLAEAERYVGTAGGGMDQASSLLGRAGHAIAIDFDPLRVTPIPMPAEWRIVVGHSGQTAEKSGEAQVLYNRRTSEAANGATRVTAALIERGRLRFETAPRLGPGGLALYPPLLAALSLAELLEAGDAVLDGGVARRFRHVTSEAARVEAALACVRAGDLVAMGGLFDASHRSLRDDYEVSTPALDDLVAIMRSSGASGARLTGAGMGGCAIALCHVDTVEQVLEEVRRFESGREGPRIAFIATAGDGASVRAVP